MVHENTIPEAQLLMRMREIISGVYAIWIPGTPYVYVGESGNIYDRWLAHRTVWVWPNDFTYQVIREMPNSTRRQRWKTERALSRLLLRRGYLLLNETAEQQVKKLRANWTPEASYLGGRTAAAKMNLEERTERMRRNIKMYWDKLSPAERSAEIARRHAVRRAKKHA